MVNVFKRLVHQARIRPRLLAGLVVGVLVAWCPPQSWAVREVTRVILGWNVGAWLYLGLAGWMMLHADRRQIHRRAHDQDEGARVILLMVVVSALASLVAIVAELAVAKDHKDLDKLAHIGLAVVTLLTSWAFAQLSFALHYAHDYYLARSQGKPGGLTFPDTEEPDYVDFLYFSAVIGTSGQTADVAFSSPHMRRIGLLHCVLAFVFNTSLIGLMVNVGSSLL
jgi:uncharacterized membrane protein